MWLSRAKAPALASAIVKSLVDQELILTESPADVQADVLAVLEQYMKDDEQLSSKARDLASARQGGASEQGRIKKDLARRQGIGVGEEAIDYLLAQLVEMLMHSGGVEEIFGEDHQLKLAMRTPLRKELASAEQLEETLRKRMKHVQEGSSQWEIEYQRLREEMTRRRS